MILFLQSRSPSTGGVDGDARKLGSFSEHEDVKVAWHHNDGIAAGQQD